MRQALILPLILLAGLFAVTGAGAAQSNAEDRELQGSWKVISLHREGARVPSNGSYVGILIYENKIVFDNQRAEARTLTYRTNRSKSPMQLDVFDEQDKELLMKTIFKIEKGLLQICIGNPRPTHFETAKNDGRELFVLELRAKD